MRTTVTLDDDVVAALARLEKKEGKSQKELINTAIREFVIRRVRPSRTAEYRTPVVDLGKCLVGSLDDVAETFALAEGDDFR
jgi:metal-responsive CopG/Arc/MetJ family transcriptional regulator